MQWYFFFGNSLYACNFIYSVVPVCLSVILPSQFYPIWPMTQLPMSMSTKSYVIIRHLILILYLFVFIHLFLNFFIFFCNFLFLLLLYSSLVSYFLFSSVFVLIFIFSLPSFSSLFFVIVWWFFSKIILFLQLTINGQLYANFTSSSPPPLQVASVNVYNNVSLQLVNVWCSPWLLLYKIILQ